MASRIGRAGIAAAALLAALPSSRGQAAPGQVTPASVLAAMERVADWQIANPSQHPPTDWTEGTADTGFMALAGISGSPRYRDAMLAAGEKSQWKLGPKFYHAADHTVGQMYAEIYLIYRDPRMLAPLRAQFDGILAKPSSVASMDISQPYELATELWSWCDALFVAPPAWMRLYWATGDTRYMDFAVKNWWRTTDFLYDKNERLFYRDSSFFNKAEANGRKVFWSRGNGWVMGGLVRMLQYLPRNHPDRPRFERLFTDMSARILSLQQADGLWRVSLLAPEGNPQRETSGTAFYTYALAWGVNQGLLDPAKFEPAVQRAWSALLGCVEPDGRLAHVQPIGAGPEGFPDGSTEDYGVGAFLLAGSEVYRSAVMGALAPASRGDPPSAASVRPHRSITTVTNPSGFFRSEETVEIDPRTLAPAGGYAVMDGVSSRIIPSQLYASEPGRPADRLIFQVDLAPGETRVYYVLDSRALAAVPPSITRTYARIVPERSNEMPWESDRIAHRMFSKDLLTSEGTLVSGIDVWAKRTRAPIIEEWYKRPNYHVDDGDGQDDYQVGRSCGCGGLGAWSGGKLYLPSNFKRARLITTGPVRSEFEVTFDPWDAGGRTVSERRRISIDAGSNLSRAESVLESDDRSPVEIAIGIAQRAGVGTKTSTNREAGWMTYWQAPDRDRGSIGCAVALRRGSVLDFVVESASIPALPPEKQLIPGSEGLPPVGNLLAITRVEIGKPVVYYIGAGWSRSGDFPDEAAWDRYVAQRTECIEVPLLVATAP